MVGELVEELVVDVLLHEHPRDEGEDEVGSSPSGRGVGGRSRKMEGEKGSEAAR